MVLVAGPLPTHEEMLKAEARLDKEYEELIAKRKRIEAKSAEIGSK